ncbi:hypothetical protein TBLA_0B01640 [Henningerozyma blattae CBS 6284]|uniref:SH3 domain-containing protein n=1 Tax=Henningerozyma blattae (strain ATCC 34711 / CBS 6284 / DSM 70876 / NBRC 10599 / NRRL Y-10934 / UCD 77-7) TaxID=1071380 RepID=I2GY05_HENB6|nr:hypothetical protein TBLA_0B01640 [Tetrapisispora blattae CBS 6284]CCH59007.1 hypothetical protein TBLA_0B01640 [Tetrapisispora blattae CBS 6284]
MTDLANTDIQKKQNGIQIKSISGLNSSNAVSGNVASHPFSLLSGPLNNGVTSKKYGSNAASSDNVPPDLILNTTEKDLLNDPSLVETYSDILKMKPGDFKSSIHSNTTSTTGSEEDNSVAGSVVITPTATGAVYSKLSFQESFNDNKESIPTKTSLDVERNNSIGTNRSIHSEDNTNISKRDSQSFSLTNTSVNTNNTNNTNNIDGYDYSDSDFEENLEKRLRDMNGTSDSLKKWRKEMKDSIPDDLDRHTERGSVAEVEEEEGGNNSDDTDSDDNDDYKEEGDDSHKEKGENEPSLNNISDEDAVELYSDDLEDAELDNDDFDELEDDQDLDYYSPLPPPKELDPERLYALYPFDGPDPSHCQLDQDEPCVLLNDQDAYWWLVKRIRDSKIGFAPAEILETYPERLARLNCWKNENMSSNNIEKSIYEHKEEEIANESETLDNQEIKKPNKPKSNIVKSVNFSSTVSYAERYIQDSNEESDDELGLPMTSPLSIGPHKKTGNESKNKNKFGDDIISHYDEFSEEQMTFLRPGLDDIIDDDDVSEVVSDVSFVTASMTPLNVKKTRSQSKQNPSSPLSDSVTSPSEQRERLISKATKRLNISPTTSTPQSNNINNDNDNEIEDSKEDSNHKKDIHELLKTPSEKDKLKLDNNLDRKDELEQIFQAPIVPFTKSKIAPSGSQNSLLTIGEFSPSSSECTTDSPPLKSSKEFTSESGSVEMPSSKAFQDISHFIDESVSVDTDDSHDGEDEDGDGSTNNLKKTINDQVLGSLCEKDSTSGTSFQDKIIDNLDDTELKNNIDPETTISSHTSSSSEGFYMQAEKATSSVSTESSFPLSKPSSQQIYQSSVLRDYPHSLIEQLYDPIFIKLDNLMKHLDEIVQSP